MGIVNGSRRSRGDVGAVFAWTRPTTACLSQFLEGPFRNWTVTSLGPQGPLRTESNHKVAVLRSLHEPWREGILR